MSEHRFFKNTFQDFQASIETSSLSSRRSFATAAVDLKNKIVEATWPCRSTVAIPDPFLYTGVLGTAFLCLRSYEGSGNVLDLDICLDIVQRCLSDGSGINRNSFLCGRSGPAAIGAVASHYAGNTRAVGQYLSHLTQLANEILVDSHSDNGEFPAELLYGSVGYLWSTLYVNQKLGQDSISDSVTRPIVNAVIKNGQAMSKAQHASCPLMYSWHGSQYLGAAHGVAGILHVLLHFTLDPTDMMLVEQSLRFLVLTKLTSGNFPSRVGSNRDELVHWCHGAPGIALTLCKASQVFDGETRQFFLQAAMEAAEVVWKRGLLKRLALCHGISGNAYVFLSLYRLTGSDRHLYRATMFGKFLLENWMNLVLEGELRQGDRPYSLMEGVAGMAWLWMDLDDPTSSAFPAYEISGR